jgi:hypothetical protein
LFLNITQQDASTIWAIPFSDLAPLVPLLGLSIPAAQQSMLKNLTVALEKIPQ